LAVHPHPWLKKCFKKNCKIIMARAIHTGTIKSMKKREKATPPVVLLSTEEWRQGIQAALHWLYAHASNRTKDVQAYSQAAFLEAEPA
jgi:hypothetical protein